MYVLYLLNHSYQQLHRRGDCK